MDLNVWLRMQRVTHFISFPQVSKHVATSVMIWAQGRAVTGLLSRARSERFVIKNISRKILAYSSISLSVIS